MSLKGELQLVTKMTEVLKELEVHRRQVPPNICDDPEDEQIASHCWMLGYADCLGRTTAEVHRIIEELKRRRNLG